MTFRKCWSMSSKKQICYDDGRLFVDNYSDCYTLTGFDYKPTKIYTLNLNTSSGNQRRIIDTQLYSAPVHKTPIPASDFKPFLLAVTSDNCLLRIDNCTGVLLQEIYLGNAFKFIHVDWETQGETIALQSTKCSNPEVLQVMAVFSIFPLQFIGAFEISKAVFDYDVTSANLSEGLLIVGCGTSKCKFVRFYSLCHILNERNFKCKCKLNDVCHLLDKNRSQTCVPKVGVNGIPINVELMKKPPLLLEVDCSEEIVFFGGYPWHYVHSPAKKFGTFHVKNLETQSLAVNGVFNSTEADALAFHVDDSGRLVCTGPKEISFYKLVRDDDKVTVVKQFSLNPLSWNQSSVKGDVNRVKETELKRSKRCVYRRNYAEGFEERLIVADDYENELEFFSILVNNGRGKRGTIFMFDNTNGSLIKKIDVGTTIDDELEYTLIMDVDTFIVTAKGKCNWTTHVLRMIRKTDIEEQ